MANPFKNNSSTQHQVPDRCAQCTDRMDRIFCNLPDDAIERFDEIAMQIAYPSRSIVFEEGQRAQGIFVVCSGQIKLAATSRDGRTMILKIAVPGDVLGLTATLNDLPYEVTAETLEPCQIRSVRRRDFLEFSATTAMSAATPPRSSLANTTKSSSTRAASLSPAPPPGASPSYSSTGPAPVPAASPSSASLWPSLTRSSPIWPAPPAKPSPASSISSSATTSSPATALPSPFSALRSSSASSASRLAVHVQPTLLFRPMAA